MGYATNKFWFVIWPYPFITPFPDKALKQRHCGTGKARLGKACGKTQKTPRCKASGF